MWVRSQLPPQVSFFYTTKANNFVNYIKLSCNVACDMMVVQCDCGEANSAWQTKHNEHNKKAKIRETIIKINLNELYRALWLTMPLLLSCSVVFVALLCWLVFRVDRKLNSDVEHFKYAHLFFGGNFYYKPIARFALRSNSVTYINVIYVI